MTKTTDPQGRAAWEVEVDAANTRKTRYVVTDHRPLPGERFVSAAGEEMVVVRATGNWY